jgi:hypothetical protein
MTKIQEARAILERIAQLSGGENIAAIRHDILEAHRLLVDDIEDRAAGGRARWKGTKKKDRSSAASAAARARWKTKKHPGK